MIVKNKCRDTEVDIIKTFTVAFPPEFQKISSLITDSGIKYINSTYQDEESAHASHNHEKGNRRNEE